MLSPKCPNVVDNHFIGDREDYFESCMTSRLMYELRRSYLGPDCHRETKVRLFKFMKSLSISDETESSSDLDQSGSLAVTILSDYLPAARRWHPRCGLRPWGQPV